MLGWGGFWGWDPVENAALLPWLTATAYIHSVIVQDRRGLFRIWNLSLAIATFAFTVLGHLLHPFGRPAERARVLLVHPGPGADRLLRPDGGRGGGAASPGAVTSCDRRWGWTTRRRARDSSSPTTFSFVGFAFVVLLGTVFPLLYEAVNGEPGDRRHAVLRGGGRAGQRAAAVLDGARPGGELAHGRRAPCSGSECASRPGRRWPVVVALIALGVRHCGGAGRRCSCRSAPRARRCAR